jgi:hypothetical protein
VAPQQKRSHTSSLFKEATKLRSLNLNEPREESVDPQDIDTEAVFQDFAYLISDTGEL